MCSWSPLHPAPCEIHAHVSSLVSFQPFSLCCSHTDALTAWSTPSSFPLNTHASSYLRALAFAGLLQVAAGLVLTQMSRLSQRQPLTNRSALPLSTTLPPPGILYHSGFQPGVLLPLRRHLVMSGDICSCHSWRGTTVIWWVENRAAA